MIRPNATNHLKKGFIRQIVRSTQTDKTANKKEQQTPMTPNTNQSALKLKKITKS